MTLSQFFRDHPKIALAFSGGTDSACLLWAAQQAGADVAPYFISTPFQPAFEGADARRLAKELGAPLRVVEVDVLAAEGVADNPPRRCYFCKKALFTALKARAAADSYPVIIDGTNASDDAGDRPGMAALRELGVLSPLRLCGLTKGDVRRLSREAGLFTWNKPSYACLATRFPAGRPIRAEDLRRVEEGEAALMARGYRNLRLRLREDGVLLQLPADQLPRAREEWPELKHLLAPWFHRAALDDTPRGEE